MDSFDSDDLKENSVETEGLGYLLFDDGTKACMPKDIRVLEQSWIRKEVEKKYSGNNDILWHIVEVFIPRSCMVIGHHAFDFCQKLRKVRIADESDLRMIDDSAFIECKELVDFDFNSLYDLTYIGGSAFALSGLRNVEIGRPEITLAREAFYRCEELRTVDIDGNVIIPEKCFASCYKLKYVTIGHSVRFIEREAFGECKIVTFECDSRPFLDECNDEIKLFFS